MHTRVTSALKQTPDLAVAAVAAVAALAGMVSIELDRTPPAAGYRLANLIPGPAPQGDPLEGGGRSCRILPSRLSLEYSLDLAVAALAGTVSG